MKRKDAKIAKVSQIDWGLITKITKLKDHEDLRGFKKGILKRQDRQDRQVQKGRVWGWGIARRYF